MPSLDLEAHILDVFKSWPHLLPTYPLCGAGQVALLLCASGSSLVKWEQYQPTHRLVMRVK